jgi:sugar phosphate isomerase/epimerase
MNIGGLCKYFPLKDVCAMVRSAGFDSVDYSLEFMKDPEHIFSNNDYLDVTDEIRNTIEGFGLTVSQTHAPFSFTQFADPDAFRDFIYPNIVRSIEISAGLGAKTIIVHPLHHMLYSGHEEEIFQLNMEYYRSLIPVARNCGIKIAVENMFQKDSRRGCIAHDTCSSIPDFLRYIDTLNSPWITACLDIGHVGLPMQKDEPWDFIRALGHTRLGALHIHDNNYKNDDHVLPFCGKIDWMEVTRALGEIEYDGDFTYEVRLPGLIQFQNKELATITLTYAGQIGKYLVDQVNSNRPN